MSDKMSWAALSHHGHGGRLLSHHLGLVVGVPDTTDPKDE